MRTAASGSALGRGQGNGPRPASGKRAHPAGTCGRGLRGRDLTGRAPPRTLGAQGALPAAAPLPGLPPSPRAGPPPAPRTPCAPDARPAARAQRRPHLVTPTTSRPDSGNEIKSLGRGGDVHPNHCGRCQALRGHRRRRPEPASGPARGLPRPVAGGCAPRAVSSPTGSPRLPGRPRRRGFPGPAPRVPPTGAPGLEFELRRGPRSTGPGSRAPAPPGTAAPHRWKVSCFLRLL